jgi:diacylglycerol kinase
MKLELLVSLATFAFYMAFEQGAYEASWRVHLFTIVVPILILKYVKDLDLKARIFIMTILSWNIIDVLNSAIDTGLKNDSDYQCTSTVSISKNEKIVEEAPSLSSTEKDSTSSSLQQQMDE